MPFLILILGINRLFYTILRVFYAVFSLETKKNIPKISRFHPCTKPFFACFHTI